MASAIMAKLVSLLCLSLLVAQVAHVESARLLRQYYERVQASATTFPAEKTERSEAAEPVTVETEYNYSATDTTPEDAATTEEVTSEEAAGDGVFATEGIVEGETTPDIPVGQQAYMFETAMSSHQWYAALPFSAQAEQDDQDERDD